MTDDRNDPRTVIAVLTYRRTERLPRLLGRLREQAHRVSPPAEVVVVDNDPDAGAAEVVLGWRDHGVRYVHEPRPGISAARNRALAEAGTADLLVFLDDDELPGPSWLTSLVDAWSAWRCAAVAGPVPARPLGPVDAWVAGSGAFDRVRRRTGTVVPGAGAGNLLLDLHQVRALGLAFDERFGLTGGEDTLLTHQLVRAGAEIRWCDEAEAVEDVPAERLTRSWVLRRCLRSGSSWSRAEVHVAGSARARLRVRALVVARAAVRVAAATLSLAAARLRRDVGARARAESAIASQAGAVVGAFGHVREEYARRPADAATRKGGPRHALAG
ncbi:glycosyltransferase family 2 protein [Geodermatophilus sp. SYSU D00525]